MRYGDDKTIQGGKTHRLLSLGMILFLSACAPMNSQDLAKAVAELAKDNASACIIVIGGAGTGMVVPGPAVPIGGGYGYLTACRSNQSGSKITIHGSDMVIEHGTIK